MRLMKAIFNLWETKEKGILEAFVPANHFYL